MSEMLKEVKFLRKILQKMLVFRFRSADKKALTYLITAVLFVIC